MRCPDLLHESPRKSLDSFSRLASGRCMDQGGTCPSSRVHLVYHPKAEKDSAEKDSADRGRGDVGCRLNWVSEMLEMLVCLRWLAQVYLAWEKSALGLKEETRHLYQEKF